jgi:hypothetical protein
MKSTSRNSMMTTASPFGGKPIIPIKEDEEYDYIEREDEEEKDIDVPPCSSISTRMLAKQAEEEMKEMQSLLSKLKTGTATRVECEKLKLLSKKLSKMRAAVTATKTRESDDKLSALRSRVDAKKLSFHKAVKEKEVRQVLSSLKSAESVDLAFIIDCTESMQSLIDQVKSNIKDIVRQIEKTNDNLNLRLAVVAYRDLGDAKRFEVFDFITSIDEFESNVSGLYAEGGADAPEDMAIGIQKANELNWVHPTRVVFLIADYPCHGIAYHTYQDSYPSGTPGINIESELRSLLLNHKTDETMTVNFGRITSNCDKMIEVFQGNGLDIQPVCIEDAKKLTKCVTSTVRRSIFKTMGVTMDTSKMSSGLTSINDLDVLLGKGGSSVVSLKKYSLSPYNIPVGNEWKSLDAVKVNVYRNKSLVSMKELKTPVDVKFSDNHSTMLMRRASEPFGEGQSRIAFHGQLAKKKKDLDLKSSAMVMKTFKHIGKGIHDRKCYLDQMEVSNIAHFLAKEYNKSSSRPGYCAKIDVVQACVVEEQDEKHELKGERRFCAEVSLPTSSSPFTKYSNNTGYWDEDVLDESLLRFTLFTYYITDGYLLVSDLQGVKDKNRFILTDPAILCTDILRFGNTNLGTKLMSKCIKSAESHMAENGWH